MITPRSGVTALSGEWEPAQARQVLPAWGFVALYAVLLFCIPTRLVVGPIGAPGSPANLLAMVGLLWWLCALIGGQLGHKGLPPLRIAIALFVSMVFASYAAGHIQGWYQPADIRPRYGAQLWRVADVPEMLEVATSASDRGLLALAGWIGIALLTAEGLRDWRDLDRIMNWVVGAASVVAILGVTQYFTGLNLAASIRIPGLSAQSDFGEALSRSDLNRVVSTSTHPIELGVVMAAMLPLAIHVGLRARRPVRWLPAVVIGVATLMTVSRSGIVVAAVAMIILIIGWPMRLRIVAALVVPVLGIVGPVVLPGLLGTIRSLFTNLENDPSIEGRTDDYGLVARMVAEQPLFGRGLFTWVPMVYRTIDNQVLVLLLEIGIIGTLSFLLVVVVGMVLGIRVRLRGADEVKRNAGLSISASLAGVLTSYLTFDALGFRQVAGLTFLLVGMAGAVWSISRADQQLPRSSG